VSARVGKRKGIRICTDVREPVFPSRWCRLIGHSWHVTRGWKWQGNPEWCECQRCGAKESWYDYDTTEGSRALASRGCSPDE